MARSQDSGVPAPATWVRLLPLAVVLTDLTLDMALPQHVPAGFLFIALPAFTAFSAGPRAIAATTVLAIALETVLGARVGHLFEQHHVAAYATTALVGVVSTALAYQRRQQNHDLVHARTVAEALQRALLRPVPERLGPLRTAGVYRPADASTISGDLYDLAETPFGYRALIGDVRGKGLAAVQTVAAVLGTFREAAHETADLTEVAARLDRRLQRESAHNADAELFVTATVVDYDPATGTVEVVNRGHLDPLVVSSSGVRPLPTVPALPLGLGDLGGGLDGDAAGSVRHLLEPGEVLLLHTDGASEARDGEGEFYPLQDRLAARFAGGSAPTPAEVVVHLDDELAGFCERSRDDLALLALSR